VSTFAGTRQDSSSPTKSSGLRLRLAATASPRTHLKPESKEEDEARRADSSKILAGSGLPYGLPRSTVHASHACSFATDYSTSSMVLHLHLHAGQGLNMGDSTIGRAAVMCRRSLVCTSALANRALVAVKVGFSQRLFWAFSMGVHAQIAR
jgi:hypothetical protein